MKLESLNNDKFKRLTPEQTKLVNGGFATGYNRERTGNSRSYYIDDGNGGRVLITEYEYNLYTSDEQDEQDPDHLDRFGFYGTNWGF